MKIYNVGNKSINLYLLDSGTRRLLIDSGFPGQLNELGREMRKTGYKIKDINFLIVTHFHIDHAGAIQELKNEGVKFMLVDTQTAFIKAMENMTTGKWKYTPLNSSDNIILSIENSGAFLKQINFHGQVIRTPAHSEDSISLVFDSGDAFTGDLLPEHLIMNEEALEKASWTNLKNAGAKIIHPGHGNEYELKRQASKT